MRRSLLLIGLVLLALLSACGQPAPASVPTSTPPAVVSPSAVVAQELNIFAVAPFNEAFTALGEGFRVAHPEATLTFNFAGGPQLTAHVSQGATADVLAFNEKLLSGFVQTGRVMSGTEQLIARSQPILVVPANNPAQISTLADLANPGVRVVLGDKEVAIGQYALNLLDRTTKMTEFAPGFKDAVLANVVSYEASARAVLVKVALGEADAAIVYASDVTGPTAEQLQRINLPAELTTIANFYVAVIADSEQPELAQAFVDYLQTPDAQALLVQYNFMPAQ